jgi:hypothetical protein
MRISDGTGRQAGKVGGNRSLISEDEGLLRVWREQVVPLQGSSLRDWLNKAGNVLTSAGYRVVIYDEE